MRAFPILTEFTFKKYKKIIVLEHIFFTKDTNFEVETFMAVNNELNCSVKSALILNQKYRKKTFNLVFTDYPRKSVSYFCYS